MRNLIIKKGMLTLKRELCVCVYFYLILNLVGEIKCRLRCGKIINLLFDQDKVDCMSVDRRHPVTCSACWCLKKVRWRLNQMTVLDVSPIIDIGHGRLEAQKKLSFANGCTNIYNMLCRVSSINFNIKFHQNSYLPIWK